MEYKDDIDELTFRERLRTFIEHLHFRLFSLILIITDCTLLIIDIASNPTENEQKVFDALAMTFVTYFIIELAARIYSQGMDLFFRRWHNRVDFGIIVISFLVTLVYIVSTNVNSLVKIVVFGRFVRVFVLIRLIRVIVTEPHNLQKGVRHAVSENKRRLVKDEFDLDMTYICKNVIGMSFPSTGKMALYRNNIKDVAKYLDKYHLPGHYKVSFIDNDN